jgi:transcriptional regulator with XRE-family HTH domain
MGERFGERIKRLRTQLGLGLRQTAARAGMSATFLSRVENLEEKSPPSEEKIRALARILGDDGDLLITLAGRIPEDVEKVIIGDPTMPEFLRVVRRKKMSGEQLMKMLEDGNKKGGGRS